MVRAGEASRTDGKLVRILNSTDAAFPAGSLISVAGTWNTSRRCHVGVLAKADGTGKRPDYVIEKALEPGKVGNGSALIELQGIDTSALTSGAAVYLSASTAGERTTTAPVAAGTDRFQVGRVTRVAVDGAVQFDMRGFAGHASSSIPSSVLIEKPHHDAGGVAVAWVRFTGNISDGDRIGIAAAGGTARVYEFDTAANSSLGAGADVRVNINAAQTNTASAAALVTAINGDASRIVNAYASGAMVALVAKDQDTQTAFVVTDPVDTNSRIVLSGAAAVGNASRAARRRLSGRYTVTAADVTALAASVPVILAAFSSTDVPQLQSVQPWRGSNSSWAKVADGSTYNILQVNSNYYGLFISDAQSPAVLAAGDVIAFELVATR